MKKSELKRIIKEESRKLTEDTDVSDWLGYYTVGKSNPTLGKLLNKLEKKFVDEVDSLIFDAYNHITKKAISTLKGKSIGGQTIVDVEFSQAYDDSELSVKVSPKKRTK